ncbi:MAG: isocitrate lyase/PEP mutase family protein [Acidimicrobiales bacterium]
MAGPDVVVAPGAYDALSARMVEAAGFTAVYMTGFGTSASLLGRPDVGLTDMGEMVGNARRMAAAISVPLIADADTGYGNAVNVVRTVQEYERAGVAAIHLEDQVAPKRCGHVAGKQVVPVAEMVAKIRAAIAARRDPDLVIVARTDARAVEGLGRALERAAAYAEAGADAIFVEAPESEAEVAEVARSLAGVPLLFNWAEGGRTPAIGMDLLARLGYRIVIFPVGALLAATGAIVSYLAELRRAGTPERILAQLTGFEEFLELIGLPEIRSLEQRFGTGAED